MARKRSVCLIVILLLSFSFCNVGAFAGENDYKEQNRGMYIRSCVAFEPSYVRNDYTHYYVGCAHGDNRYGSNPLILNYKSSTGGTVSATVSSYAESSTEVDLVLEKMSLTLGIGVTYSRSWAAQEEIGASYTVSPGDYEILCVYIPSTRTEGRLKYHVYMDGYPENDFYEYQTLTRSWAPQENSYYFKIIQGDDE